MNNIITIVSLFVGVLSLVYAVITNREKAKLEAVVENILLNISSNVQDIVDNAALAYIHIDATRRYLNALKHSRETKTILDRTAYALADITATHRMSKRLKTEVDSLREGLFLGENKSHYKESTDPNRIKTLKNEDVDKS